MGGRQNRPTRNTTTSRQIGSKYKNQHTQEQKLVEINLGAKQYLSKTIENLSANTDILRKLLKKQNELTWIDKRKKAFKKLKEGTTETPCLSHYKAQNENIHYNRYQFEKIESDTATNAKR